MAKSEWRKANSEITKVGIVGEGKMGTNLFYFLLDCGFEMVWVCSADADIEKIRRTFEKKMRRMVDAGFTDKQTCLQVSSRTTITNSLQSLNNCDLVIEAISEDPEGKKNLFRSIAEIVPDYCILTSNSSSIAPSRLSDSPEIRKRIVGLHFFYPVALKNISEIMITSQTSAGVIESVRGFMTMIRREYLLLHENDGFILNRIFMDVQNEACLICKEEALSFRQVDAIIKNHLFPIGAFELCDNVGIDTMLASVSNYISLSPNTKNYTLFRGLLEDLVSRNRLGVKTEAGFYDHATRQDDETLVLGGISKELTDRIRSRLLETLQASVAGFASQTGIPAKVLSDAIKEYLGADILI